jgi:hypothetical protein
MGNHHHTRQRLAVASAFNLLGKIGVLSAMTQQSSAGNAEAIIEEAMWMLQDVPGNTLVERIARLTKWYQDLCSNASAQAAPDTRVVLTEALRNCGCPSDRRGTIGECQDAGTCGCSIPSTEGK